MRRFVYCGSALGLDLETVCGPGSERCCLCKRNLGRYYRPIVGEVVTTSDGSEVCDYCISEAFEPRRMPKYSEAIKINTASREETTALCAALDSLRAAFNRKEPA